LGFLISASTSPVAAGYKSVPGVGDATAVMLMLVTVADCACPLDPELSPTTQFVAA